ncbi:unnamed protein product [Ambrosiozyma monospora]|uniref:Unnamed protein product n=1 Tax=Ambrosiozyma monospora TaxID=43982 RepID=A0A9W6YS00_AMBMO|nr:unnamed protein product [Ambrosiozyma monospora]
MYRHRDPPLKFPLEPSTRLGIMGNRESDCAMWDSGLGTWTMDHGMVNMVNMVIDWESGIWNLFVDVDVDDDDDDVN